MLQIRTHIVLTIILLLSLIVGSHLAISIPIFSDGVYHASIVDNIIEKGVVSMENPIGHNDFFLDNIEETPKISDPIYFYLVAISYSLITGVSGGASISGLGILFTILSVFIVFGIVRKITKNTINSIMVTLLFSIAPILYWIMSHRLIESLLFLFILLIFYLLLYTSGNLIKNKLYVICIVSVLIINTKITGFFFVVFVLVTLLVQIPIKRMLLLTVIGSILLTPFVLFYFNQGVGIYPKKNISYSSPNVGIQHELDIESSSNTIISNLLNKDSDRLRNLYYHIDNYNLNGIIQYFTIFKTDNQLTDNHELGEMNWGYFFAFVLIIFLIGKYKNRKIIGSLRIWHIVSILILTSIFLRIATSINRYGFYFNILTFIIIFPSLIEFIKNKLAKMIFLSILLSLSIAYYTNFNIVNSMQYIYSFDHNPLFTIKKSFTTEFNLFSKGELFKKMQDSKCIYTASREFGYYSGVPIKWDSRINSLDSKLRFNYYYDKLIGCKYIVTPQRGGGIVNEKFIKFFGNPIYNGEVFYVFEYK